MQPLQVPPLLLFCTGRSAAESSGLLPVNPPTSLPLFPLQLLHMPYPAPGPFHVQRVRQHGDDKQLSPVLLPKLRVHTYCLVRRAWFGPSRCIDVVSPDRRGPDPVHG
ncbi:uncharacterized protein LY79DRAFT_39213 [Colletotrichum navitas]|uniref:Uncharacterized protein n=1 Tax=Colletotrichum navitas TaxID=681940 RepID=A0AAD8PMR5_9PEZI|nr:uncharacterized protein LY79DRAFT_39213 [Colletotrichum navitas]KAK1572980.1 hypothetical protein LY79DRAFT_39213 [Colletotrichum navitas]